MESIKKISHGIILVNKYHDFLLITLETQFLKY